MADQRRFQVETQSFSLADAVPLGVVEGIAAIEVIMARSHPIAD